MEDPRLQYVELSLTSNAHGVDASLSLLTEANMITAEETPARREQILSGTVL